MFSSRVIKKCYTDNTDVKFTLFFLKLVY